MERLYSNFVNGWPGQGLLLLRVAVFVHALTGLPYSAWAAPGVAAGALVAVGLWTPLAAAVAALLALAAAWRGPELTASLLAAAIAASLAALGPGAWSIDARRFGRRKIAGSAGTTKG